MQTIERVPRIAAVAFTVVLAVCAGCTENKESASPLPTSRGVFYQPAQGKPVPLLNGSAIEMVARATPITGTMRPAFTVSFPILRPADIRLAVNLSDNRPGPFDAIDVTVTPVEGQAGVYHVQPTADLPPGLCAVVVSAGAELTNDVNNAYPFKLEAPPQ